MASNGPIGLSGVPSPCSSVPVHHPTWRLRGVGRKAANPARDRSDFLVGDGLPLAVSCMRSSTILEGSRRDEISRFRSGIFSHHSAEYLAHIIASRLASRLASRQLKHNRGEIMYTICHRGCSIGAAAEGPSALFLRRRTSARRLHDIRR